MNMHVINFTMNKFCPFLIIGFLSFYKMGYECFEPYVIIALSFFISHFHFKTGYAVAYCEQNNISLDSSDNE